jgi:hypothetical protein
MRIQVLFGLSLVGTSLVMACNPGNEPDPIAEVVSGLQGDWSSVGCEDVGNGVFLLRDFNFTGNTWQITGGIFSDAACTAENFSFFVEGPFEVLGESAALTGVFETDFGSQIKTLTPANQGIVDFLNTQPPGSCGAAAWVVGTSQDIAITGCAAFGLDKAADCPEEHDLVSLNGDSLILGDRSASLCEIRPTVLSTFPLVRQ